MCRSTWNHSLDIFLLVPQEFIQESLPAEQFVPRIRSSCTYMMCPTPFCIDSQLRTRMCVRQPWIFLLTHSSGSVVVHPLCWILIQVEQFVPRILTRWTGNSPLSTMTCRMCVSQPWIFIRFSRSPSDPQDSIQPIQTKQLVPRTRCRCAGSA